MSMLDKKFALNFYIRGITGNFAYRSSFGCPNVGDKCVFNDKRYVVCSVEWCMDLDASNTGQQRINIELEQQ